MGQPSDRQEAGSRVPSGEAGPASAVNTATTADTVLHELSTGTGPSVLLVHGLGSSSELNWVATRWVTSLAAAGFHVWSVDLPAHGQAAPAPLVTRDFLAREIVEHARNISSNPIHAVGYSLGAQLVYQCAAREPALFSRLILGGFSMANRLPAVLDAPDFLLTPAQRELAERLAPEPFPADLSVPCQPALLFSGADDAWSTSGDRAEFLARRRRPDRCETTTNVHVEPRRNHVNVVTSKRVRLAATEFLAGRTPGAVHSR